LIPRESILVDKRKQRFSSHSDVFGERLPAIQTFSLRTQSTNVGDVKPKLETGGADSRGGATDSQDIDFSDWDPTGGGGESSGPRRAGSRHSSINFDFGDEDWFTGAPGTEEIAPREQSQSFHFEE
jgi:hypothetical protein